MSIGPEVIGLIRDSLGRIETRLDDVGADAAEARRQATKTNGSVAALAGRVSVIENDRRQERQERLSTWERWKDRLIPVAGTLIAVALGHFLA